MSELEEQSVTKEHEFHNYTGNQIPWYVRFIWLLFWIFAVYYAIKYLFGAVQVELFQG